MLCSNCQTQLIPESNYCHMCGVVIPKAKVTGVLGELCSACGITLVANAEICSNCGAQVGQPHQIFAHTVRYLSPKQVEQLYKAADKLINS